MSLSTYCIIEEAAGGVHVSKYAIIRACWNFMSCNAKRRDKRRVRHEFYREMLEYQRRAQKLTRTFLL